MTMTLSGLLTHYAGQRLKFSTRSEEEYATSVTNFSAWLERAATTDDLTDDNLTAYLRHRCRTKSSHTARKDRAQLLTLWRHAWRKRFVPEQPRDVPSVPVARKRVKAWSPEEIGRLLEACGAARRLDGWDVRHDRALTLTIYDTAERIGALLRCPASEFDPTRRTLVIPADVRKRGAADQVASLHPDTVAAIDRTMAGPRERLFPWPMCYRSLLRRFKRIFKAAGISTANRKPFHDLRRTSYTLTHAVLGKDAARAQCGHTADLSAYYLDTALLADLNPHRRVADVITRPSRPSRMEA